MNNKFILNETTGIGIIEDDKSRNILFKTEGNEEEVREVLEKENEVENEIDKIVEIKRQLEDNHSALYIKFVSYGGAFFTILIPLYSLVYPQDNNENVDTLSNSGKAKILRKKF